MCLGPEVLAGLALSGAGTYLQSREAVANEKRGMNAKNAAFQQNIDRNTQYANDASVEANKNVQAQGANNFTQQQQNEANKMVQLFNERRTQPDYNIGLTENAPKNVVLAREAAGKVAADKTDRDIENNAGLQGYSGALFNSGLDQSNFARLFGNIQDKASANTRLMPIEMSAAYNNSQKAGSLFPTLLKLGGTGLTLAGANGAFTPDKIIWNGGGTTALNSPFQRFLSDPFGSILQGRS